MSNRNADRSTQSPSPKALVDYELYFVRDLLDWENCRRWKWLMSLPAYWVLEEQMELLRSLEFDSLFEILW